jgi:hypothetical protein
MFYQQIPYLNLEKWVETYKDSKYDKNETNNCMISLRDLEDFMNYIHKTNIGLGRKKESIIDKIRIYVIRDKEFAGSGPQLNTCQTNKGEQPQFSFVIVPMTDWKEDYYQDISKRAGGKDYVVNGNISVVTPHGEGSGLCPNNCGGSI